MGVVMRGQTSTMALECELPFLLSVFCLEHLELLESRILLIKCLNLSSAVLLAQKAMVLGSGDVGPLVELSGL